MIRLLQRISLLAVTTSTSFSQGFWGNEFPEGKIKYDPKNGSFFYLRKYFNVIIFKNNAKIGEFSVE